MPRHDHTQPCSCCFCAGGNGGGQGGSTRTYYLWEHSNEDFTRESTCPHCSESVFFVRHNGGSVWFDHLGPPWPKHGCFYEDGYGSQLRKLLIEKSQVSKVTFGVVLESETIRRGSLCRMAIRCSTVKTIDTNFQTSADVSKLTGQLVIVEYQSNDSISVYFLSQPKQPEIQNDITNNTQINDKPIMPTVALKAIHKERFALIETARLSAIPTVQRSCNTKDGVTQLKNYYKLLVIDPLNQHSLSANLDALWRGHMRATKEYYSFCWEVFGAYLYHTPIEVSNSRSLYNANLIYDYTKGAIAKSFGFIDLIWWGTPSLDSIHEGAGDDILRENAICEERTNFEFH